MKADEGRIIYETKPCWCSHNERPGQVQENRHRRFYGHAINGRTKDGKCPDCGATRKHDHQGFMPTGEWNVCGRCNGTLVVPEDRYDYMPRELVCAIPHKLFRLKRGITFNESLLGIGCLWSCQDYGWAAKEPDEKVLGKVQAEIQKHSVQACAVVDDLDRLPPAIGVFINSGGYSVRALTPDRLAAMAREYDYETGLQVGMEVFNQGGHGTLAGVYRPEPEQEGINDGHRAASDLCVLPLSEVSGRVASRYLAPPLGQGAGRMDRERRAGLVCAPRPECGPYRLSGSESRLRQTQHPPMDWA